MLALFTVMIAQQMCGINLFLNYFPAGRHKYDRRSPCLLGLWTD